MSSISKNLLVGLPESGKTTFIAALGYVVGTREVPEALELRELSDDTQYLSTISDEWSEFKPMTRTQTSFSTMISMKLAEPGSDIVTELSLPDVSGEKFQQQWRDRQWDDAYAQLVEEATGLLLLVHCDKVVEPKTIREAHIAVNRLKVVEDEEDDGEEEEEYVPWEAAKAPTGVQLVDLLQFVMDARPNHSPLRLGVIVSAWDIIEKMPPGMGCDTPEAWLKKRIPLLEQFLRANQDDFEWKVFGVSAQGVNLADSDDVKRSQRESRPARRVIVHDGKERTHDITQPIRWMMNNGKNQ